MSTYLLGLQGVAAPNLLDLPSLTLNHLVRLADFAALDHGGPGERTFTALLVHP